MDFATIKTSAKKYPLGTAAIAVLVVMSAALFFRSSTMTDTKAALEQNTSEAQRHLSNISYSAQLEEQFQALENANRTIASRLVNPQDLAINLEYFYKLERETGVKLLDTRPASPSPGPASRAPVMKSGYKPVQYAVSLQGSYSQVLTFLRRLEQGTYYCRVVTASCNLAQEDSSAEKKTASSQIVLALTVEILGKA